MLGNIGVTLVFFVFSLTLFIIYNSYLDLKMNNQLIKKNIYNLSLFQITLAALSFFTLIAWFIYSDFSIVNVYENSHTAKPLFYKIAGAWGNHEGSLLLWLVVSTLFIFLFLISSKDLLKRYRILTVLFQQIIIIGFFVFLPF